MEINEKLGNLTPPSVSRTPEPQKLQTSTRVIIVHLV